MLAARPARCPRSSRAAAAPSRRPCRRRPRGSRPAAGAPRGGWRSAARPIGGRRRARSRCRSRPRSAGARRSAARRASDEAADAAAPTPTRIALFGGERPGRAQRQQAVEGERAEGAGRDQRGQLVEGAVADPAVVVVVEAVQLETRIQTGLKRTAQKRVATSVVEVVAVATQSAATIATQSPAASRRRSRAPRRREPLGPVSAEPARRSPAAPARRPAWAAAGAAALAGVPVRCGVISSAVPSGLADRSASGFSSRARSRSACGGGFVAGLVLDLASAGSTTASCGPRGRSRG